MSKHHLKCYKNINYLFILPLIGSTVVVGGGVVVPLVYSPVKVQETEMMIIII
jgi:hypothetical protein